MTIKDDRTAEDIAMDWIKNKGGRAAFMYHLDYDGVGILLKRIEYETARAGSAETLADDLQRLPQPLKGFVPQTYGDAIQAGWIKHGDCQPHEWDNRTSAGNARWMLERFIKENLE